MNFWRYTFHRSFGYFLTSVTTLTALALVVLFIAGNKPAFTTIALCYSFLMATIMAGSYFRWCNYRTRYYRRHPQKINWPKLIRP